MTTFDLEVCVNAEGNKFAYLGKTGSEQAYRIAGPKAWGGAKTLAKLTIRENDLHTFIREYALELAQPTQAVASEGWISVLDKRPEYDVQVLIYTPNGEYGKVWLDEWTIYREDPLGMGGPTIETGEGWQEHDWEEVTHWMHIPATPAALNAAPEEE